jgi:hypothetical protein
MPSDSHGDAGAADAVTGANHGVDSEPATSPAKNDRTVEQGGGRQYYDDFISKTLDDANARKSSIEQRGINVVTTVGALLTIVFSVVSFVLVHTGSKAVNPHALIRGFIDAAGILFVLAGILGLLVNVPVPYGMPDPNDLEARLDLGDEGVADQLTVESIGSADIDVLGERSPQHSAPEPPRADQSSRFITDTASEATLTIASTRIDLLKKANKWNLLKARFLFAGVFCEVFAIAMLAWGVHRLLAP